MLDFLYQVNIHILFVIKKKKSMTDLGIEHEQYYTSYLYCDVTSKYS